MSATIVEFHAARRAQALGPGQRRVQEVPGRSLSLQQARQLFAPARWPCERVFESLEQT